MNFISSNKKTGCPALKLRGFRIPLTFGVIQFHTTEAERCESLPPSFDPSDGGNASVHLYLHVHACREGQIHQGVNGFGRGADNVYQTLMHAHFILFTRVFMNER